MRILNELNQEIQMSEINIENGYLFPDKIFIQHHDKIEEQPEKWHYECKTFYFEDDTSLDVSSLGNKDPHVQIIDIKKGIFRYLDQGEGKTYRGLDIIRVVDKERVEAKEAWDEYEDIQRYKLYTPEELEANRLANEKAEKQQQFMEQGPDVLASTAKATTENTTSIDDINLLIADLIGA